MSNNPNISLTNAIIDELDSLDLSVLYDESDMIVDIVDIIDGITYSAELSVIFGTEPEHDDYELRSEFGYFDVSPPSDYARDEDKLRSWSFNVLRDLQEMSTPRGQIRVRIWQTLVNSGLIDDDQAKALSHEIIKEVAPV